MVTVRPQTLNILIGDDHSLLREALTRLLLELEEEVRVIESTTFQDTLDAAKRAKKLDLIIIDLYLPGMSGISDIGTLRSRCPATPIVILSGYYRRPDIVRAFQLGAAGFIPKALSVEGIKNALRTVLLGELYIPGDILIPTPDKIDGADKINGTAGGSFLAQLTFRQTEVLDLLTEGLPNKVIADRLGVEEVTVKQHLKIIYKALGARNRTHAAAITLGFR